MKLTMLTKSISLTYNIALITLTVLMLSVVSFNVYMRFVVNRSLGWADELSRFLFIWLSFLGAALSYHKNEHVGLSFFVGKIRSKRLRFIINVFQTVLVITVLVFLSYFGVLAAVRAQNVSPALQIPMSFVYAILPFASILMVGIGLFKLVRLFQGFEPEFEDPELKAALEEFASSSQEET